MKTRRILRIALVLLILLAVLVAAAPFLANFGPVRGFVAQKIADTLGREVRLDGLAAGWTSGVNLRGLRVANAGPEFSDASLLEVRDVKVDDPLTALIFGDGPSRVVVSGLALNVEEQAGGRTNLDDILTRLAEAPPKEKVPEKKPVPIHVELKDCTFSFKRLTRRAPDRPVDPFREDPEIRPAGEGAHVLAMEQFRLEIRTGDVTRLEFGGGITVDGKAGHLEGKAEFGDEVTGTAKATGLDLGLLGPFVKGDLAGSLDLDVTGGPDGGTVKARVTGLKTGGEGLPVLDEAWVDLEVVARRTDEAVILDKLECKTASDEVALTGTGTVPTGDKAPEDPFRIEARFPLRLAFEPTGQVPAHGRVKLNVGGRQRDGRLDVAGSLDIKELVFTDPKLARAGANDARADFDVGYDRAASTLLIRRMESRSAELVLRLEGTTTTTEPIVCDLREVRGHADLGRAHGLLKPFLPVDEGASVAGTVTVENLALQRDAAGNMTVKADAQVRDFAATGFFEEDVRIDRGAIHVDLSLAEGGDVLVVRSGRLDELTVAGRVAGLKADKIREAEGTVKGSLDLNPMLARLAGLEGVDALVGRLTVDAAANTGKLGVQVSGTATLENFRSAGDFGRVRHRRATLEGSVTRDGNGPRVKGNAAVDGLEAEGDFGKVRQNRLTVDADVEQGNGKWHGRATVVGDHFRASTKGTPIWSEGWSTPTTVHVIASDLAALARQVPAGTLPKQLTLKGAASIQATARKVDARWDLAGTVKSTDLTALLDGDGLRGEPLALELTARRKENGWSLSVPSLVLERADAHVKVPRGFLGDDGSFTGQVDVTASLGGLARLAPAAAQYDPAGRGRFQGEVAYGDQPAVKGKLSVDAFAVTVEGRRATSDRLVVDLDAKRRKGQVELARCHVTVDRATFDATGRLGDAAVLRIVGKGDADALARFLPQGSGTGQFLLDVDINAPLEGEGPVRAKGKFNAERFAVYGDTFDRPRAEFDVGGRKTGDDYVDLTGTLLVQVASLTALNRRIADGELNATGHGALRAKGAGDGFMFQAQVRARQGAVDGIPITNPSVTVRGALRHGFLEDPHRVEMKGNLSFARVATTDLDFTDGSAQLRLLENVAHITNLSARCNGGTVTGQGRVDLGQSPLEWDGKMVVNEVQLDRRASKSISFVVPLLVSVTDVSGRLSTDVALRGRGTTLEALKDSLQGGGNIRLDGLVIRQGGLLGTIADAAFTAARLKRDRDEPYRAQTINVNFNAGHGRITPDPFTIKGNLFDVKIEGWAGLDRTLRYKLKPTFKGAKLGVLPLFYLKVEGPMARPSVKPRFEKPFGKLFD